MPDIEIDSKTIMQWIGVLAVSIALPVVVYAKQEGVKDQQLAQLHSAIQELKVSQDDTRKAIQRELDEIKAKVSEESKTNSTNGAVLQRLETKLDSTANVVTNHGEQIAVLNSKVQL